MPISSALSKGKDDSSGKTTGKPDKNFGLTADQFSHLSTALRQGDSTLFERTFLAHFEDCVSFLVHQDRKDYQRAYDASMDTLLKFRQLILEDKVTYGNLRYLFTLMARQELSRNDRKSARIVSLHQLDTNDFNNSTNLSTDDYELLTRAFSKLGKECQRLLRDFYYNKRQLKSIAEAVDRSPEAVRKQKSRCLAILRRYYQYLSR